MPKIQRETQKIFCNSAESDQLAVFGSMATGAPVYSNNIEELQNNEAFDLGWDAATLEDKAPFMEEMNGMQYGITKQLAYNFQEGIPEYDAGTTYYVGSICKILEEGKPVLYTSLTDENLGNNPVTDDTNWERLSFGGGGLEIGDIGFTQMAIDETKGKRRVLNGQLIIQEQYQQFTQIVKDSVALNPDLACTESEWQTAVTMSANGVCYKFVIDDEAGTIRLPKYPTYLDLSINTSAVSKTVSIKGNGKAMGLMGGENGAVTGGLVYTSEGFGVRTGMYNQPLATKYSSGEFAINYTAGLTTDASKSGITGSVSIPAVQSEKIKGTYFIQVATGSETEDNIINEIELNNPFSLLDYKFSEYELNNLSWLRSNGQYNSKAVYPAVYDLLLKIYNGTETKAGVSVKLSTGSYTDYDFVLNTAEETFRLPIKVKQKFFTGGDVPVVGNGMAIGVTDGSKNYGLGSGTAFLTAPRVENYGQNVGVALGGTTKSSDSTIGLTKDGTKSGIVAKISQTEVSGLYLYFYVGETVQNANLINAGRIEEKLTDLHVDINNIQNEKLDKSAVKAYITQTYVSGTSGYNIWSNGYCEQWGQGAGSTGSANVTFLKTFANTNYNIQLTASYTEASGGISTGVAVQNTSKATTGFTISQYSKANYTAYWRACGYLA